MTKICCCQAKTGCIIISIGYILFSILWLFVSIMREFLPKETLRQMCKERGMHEEDCKEVRIKNTFWSVISVCVGFLLAYFVFKKKIKALWVWMLIVPIINVFAFSSILMLGNSYARSVYGINLVAVIIFDFIIYIYIKDLKEELL